MSLIAQRWFEPSREPAAVGQEASLSAMIHRFTYLKYALSLILIFIGGKIFYAQIWGKVNPAISLGITSALLLASILVSLLRSRRRPASSG